MSGTIPLSMTQQCDRYGDPLAGGKLYFIVAATVSTPQNAFQDPLLALPWPNPITLDAAGRIPQLFLADGFVKIRLTDALGAVQLVADNVQVIGPSSGGGGGSVVDASLVAQTGDLKLRYGSGSHSGWVRCNGGTIGSSISGATELKDTDAAAALFNYLWAADPNLVLIPPRGTSAATDFSANKQLTLPDYRGRAIAGVDDMGNGAVGRITAFAATVLGAAGGEGSHLLTTAEMPNHNHTLHDPGHKHQIGHVDSGAGINVNSFVQPYPGTSGNFDSSVVPSGITIDAIGGGLTHNVTQPTIVQTVYIKL